MVKRKTYKRIRFTVALATACISLTSVAQSERLELPDMGASADSIISRQEEEEYAEALLRQMRAYEVLNEDPLITGFFRDMGYRLVANSDRPDKPFTFVVLDQPVVNAFAAPGGVVALYSGLILAADDENEVAGVLAHEVAHITQQHLYRALEHQKAMTIPLMLAMVGLILIGGGSGEAIQGALLGGQAAAQQASIYFTRQNEVEADRIGIQTLYEAGYDPRGMAEFFEKMGRISRSMGEGPPIYLRTHPVSVTRISEAEGRIMSMPTAELSSGKEFYLVQARLRATIEEYPETALDYFNHRIEKLEVSEAETDALQYGIAIALQRKGDYGQARRILKSLMARDQHIAYELQLADLDMESGRNTEALESMSGMYHNFPGNHVISMQYGRALLNLNDPEQAETASVVLRQQLLTHQDDPVLYELYARASNMSGDKIRAKEAIAEAYFLRGAINDAAQQLQELIKRDDLDYYERARITDRLHEFQAELARLGLDRQHG